MPRNDTRCRHIIVVKQYELTGQYPSNARKKQLVDRKTISELFIWVLGIHGTASMITQRLQEVLAIHQQADYVGYNDVVLLQHYERKAPVEIMDSLVQNVWYVRVPRFRLDRDRVNAIESTSPDRFSRVLVRLYKRQHGDYITCQSSCFCGDASRSRQGNKKCVHSQVFSTSVCLVLRCRTQGTLA